MPHYTPTEQAMLKVLSDGMAHPLDDLRACLSDELAVSSTVRVHLLNLRKKLRTINQDVLCVYVWGRHSKPLYRHVRLITSDD
jgi:hypothetical protein